MRIGTWTLEGRWTSAHPEQLEQADCDVWLLTEVAAGVALTGYAAVTTGTDMRQGTAWAAVLSRRGLEALPGPHPATAAARVDGSVVLSSILPWRGCGNTEPWEGETSVDRTEAALHSITAQVPEPPTVWGGDFNHALRGTEVAGSKGGAAAIRRTGDAWGLHWPTIGLDHRLAGVLTIDHVGVPTSWGGGKAERTKQPGSLSDHDLYTLELPDRTSLS